MNTRKPRKHHLLDWMFNAGQLNTANAMLAHNQVIIDELGRRHAAGNMAPMTMDEQRALFTTPAPGTQTRK